MASALIPTSQLEAGSVEKVLLQGDLERLSPGERLNYYQAVCESLGLNPLTRPFEYIKLNGRLTLYAKRECTEQLRNLRRVSIAITSREFTEGCYVVTARALFPDGRTDESIGAVAVEGLKGEARANAMMKAETKAKRRVTMAICGLSMLDETEVETTPSAQRYTEMREAADARQAARLAAMQVVPSDPVYEPVNDVSAVTVMEDEPIPEPHFIDVQWKDPKPKPGLDPPHDQQLIDSLVAFPPHDKRDPITGEFPAKKGKKPSLSRNQIDVVKIFEPLKKGYDDLKMPERYYEVLNMSPWKKNKSTEFRDQAEAQACINYMQLDLQECERWAKDNEGA